MELTNEQNNQTPPTIQYTLQPEKNTDQVVQSCMVLLNQFLFQLLNISFRNKQIGMTSQHYTTLVLRTFKLK